MDEIGRFSPLPGARTAAGRSRPGSARSRGPRRGARDWSGGGGGASSEGHRRHFTIIASRGHERGSRAARLRRIVAPRLLRASALRRVVELPFGPRPVGRLVYEADGRMIVLVTDPARPAARSPQFYEADERELADAARGCVAYSGRWTLRGERGRPRRRAELVPQLGGRFAREIFSNGRKPPDADDRRFPYPRSRIHGGSRLGKRSAAKNRPRPLAASARLLELFARRAPA